MSALIKMEKGKCVSIFKYVLRLSNLLGKQQVKGTKHISKGKHVLDCLADLKLETVG